MKTEAKSIFHVRSDMASWKKWCMAMFLVVSASTIEAQEVFWATNVISYSSQIGEKKNSAQQILGMPNATADSIGNAWAPNSIGKEESIVVSFKEPLKARQILIVETANPGYIRKVSAFDAEGLEYDVASFMAKSSVKGPRLIKVNVSDYFINITKVKIVMVPVRNVTSSVDAVGITTSDKSFVLGKTLQLE